MRGIDRLAAWRKELKVPALSTGQSNLANKNVTKIIITYMNFDIKF